MNLRRTVIAAALGLLLCLTTSWSLAREPERGDFGLAKSTDLSARPGLGDTVLRQAPSPDLYGSAITDQTSSAALDWTIETVDDAGNVGQYTSLALNAVDYPRISYYDVTNSALNVARHNGGMWQIDSVEGAGSAYSYGEYSSLALDSVDHMHVSYYGAHDNSLRYAIGDGKDWTVWSADSNGGQFSSIVLDDDDLPHVSHYDPVHQHLVYAYHDGLIWHREVVDDAGDVGRYSSLGLTPAGYPRISYYDATDGDLMFATPGKGGWFTERVDGESADVGVGSSLQFDGKGHPHISYVDATNQNLKYARHDGKGWLIDTVEGKDVDIVGYTSMVVEGDRPHIAYTVRDTVVPPSYRLKYATSSAGSWSKQTVESVGSTGLYPSLALDSGSWPHISYYDAGERRLRYAVGRAPCSEPVAGVTVNGPATTVDGSAAIFTATASPTSATLPIVFHWSATDQDDVEQVHSSVQAGLSYTWTVPGRKIVTVTATNCGGTLSATHALTVEEQLPDLTVTDVWNEGQEIWYRLDNSGTGTAMGGHHTSFEIDGLGGKDDFVGVTLAPGEGLSRTFNDIWACTPHQDVITVCVDSRDEVSESDETNNCQQETWVCDVRRPRITSGPTVYAVGTTTATIVWETDEASDSEIAYDTRSSAFNQREHNASLVWSHEVTLAGLEPASLYGYWVYSSDPYGNRAPAGPFYFQTEAPWDAVAPSLANLETTLVGQEQYELSAEAADNVGLERVEFYLDDELVGTCYTATEKYTVPLAPSKLDMARQAFYASHAISAVAVDRVGLTDTVQSLFTPPEEEMDVSVVYREPTSVYTLYTDADTVAPGTLLDVQLHAVQYAYVCSWIPDRRYGHEDCVRHEQDVAQVEFFIDGVRTYTSTSPHTGHIHRYQWDAGGLSAGTQHTIRAVAVASDGGRHLAQPARVIHVALGQPRVWVRRTVSRIGNSFQVTLTVGNGGLTDATVVEIADNLTGFQPISRTEGTDYAVSVALDPVTLHAGVSVAFGPGAVIPPGGTMDVTYAAVPILHPELEDADYTIGARPLTIAYTDWSGPHVEEQDQGCTVTADGEQIAEGVGLAVRDANLLIVTTPSRLFWHDTHHAAVNTLLSTMARLAQLKDGVLGHLTEELYGDADRARAQIRTWGSIMKQEDGTPENFLYSGYLLLVGEAEIVPTYNLWYRIHYIVWYDTCRIRDSDLWYGNTAGDRRKPELAVGRIIGNSARELTIPLETSINVYLRESGYAFDRSDALAVSGRGSGVTYFEASLDAIAGVMDDEFSVVKLKKRQVEEDGGDINAQFKANDDNRDVIVYRDHCGPNSWSGVIGTGDFGGANPIDFGDSKPFAFGCCCQAGRYEDDGEWGIAEHFLRHGAAVYVGATETSYTEPNNKGCKWVFERWVGGTRSIGQELKEVRRRFGGFDGKCWSAEYNLYGDPTYGSESTMRPLAAGGALTVTPVSSTTIVVPDYEIRDVDGEDQVAIPGGSALFELGQPVVPIYAAEIPYPPGYRVQDVMLLEQSGLVTDTGLHIPTYTAACDTGGRRWYPAGIFTEMNGWWPDRGDFDWEVSGMPDGSSILTLRLYPFRYNALTTDVEFYKTFSFQMAVITSSVGIETLSTNDDRYAQGDTIQIELQVENTGDPQDVIVETVIREQGIEEPVDGLPLELLEGLSGTAFFSSQWDSTGFEPGTYDIDVLLATMDGQVLDQETVGVRLGIYAGEVTTFTVAPVTFESGETVDASLVFSNTGTVPLTGTFVIQVQDGEGQSVEDLTQAFGALSPGTSVQFNGAWHTADAPGDAYTVLGYVHYDGKATLPQRVVVSNLRRLYLPVVMRDN